MRIMGLDYGTVRIGVALSDELQVLASPFSVIKRKERSAVKEPVREIKRIAEENGVGKIVMGLPKNLDNTDGELTGEVRKFAERLSRELKIPVVFWDERLSSVIAEKTLISVDMRREKRRERIDGVAAAVLLQGFMESMNLKRSELMDKEFEIDDNHDETEEFDLIVLEDEETGESVELVIVDSVEMENNFSYLLVVPMQEFDDECPNASIIKEYTDESGEYVYELVEDDEEFEKAAAEFEGEEEE